MHIDASLDWMQVAGGKVLWRPGDPSDSFYIVINGRLRAIDDKEEGKVRLLGKLLIRPFQHLFSLIVGKR